MALSEKIDLDRIRADILLKHNVKTHKDDPVFIEALLNTEILGLILSELDTAIHETGRQSQAIAERTSESLHSAIAFRIDSIRDQLAARYQEQGALWTTRLEDALQKAEERIQTSAADTATRLSVYIDSRTSDVEDQTRRALTFKNRLLIIGISVGLIFGWSGGYFSAYALVSDEKARANWANTELGKRLHDFSDTDLQHFVDCSEKGWRIEKKPTGKYCYPLADGKNTYGWELP